MNKQKAAAGPIRAALRYPGFRMLLSGLAVSQAGDWLYNLALVMLVYQRTHSALWAGVTTAARVVPIVVIGPFGGVIAGRFSLRRRPGCCVRWLTAPPCCGRTRTRSAWSARTSSAAWSTACRPSCSSA
jgi:hypothetical protein